MSTLNCSMRMQACMKACMQRTKSFIRGIPPCIIKTKVCCKKTLRCCKRLYRKCDIFCGALCSGRTPCWINAICFLPVLIYLSIKIYVIPCIAVILGRIFTLICCCWCRMWCPEDYIFTDNQFPTNIISLQLEDKKIEKSVLWIRAHDLATEQEPDEEYKTTQLKICQNEEEDEEYEEYEQQYDEETDTEYKKPEMYLFRNGIVPSDVVQGALGDCWLLAAIACLAEFPGAIENCFCSYEKSERHKYYIKLYDARRGIEEFKKIYVDDYIPCDDTTKRPIFAKPKGNELWVLLLEKAFAKFVGNYGRLDGGHTLWAFQAMTGCHCMRLEYDKGSNDDEQQQEAEEEELDRRDEEEEEEEEEEDEDEEEEMLEMEDILSEESFLNGPCWRKWNIEYDEAIHIDNPREDYGWIDSGEAFDNKKLFLLLKKYDSYGALIAASVTNKGENKREDGIIEGHAYTIKQIFSFKKYKLINLRNPWGTFEWKGKWSDYDTARWNKHKKIAKKVKFLAADDGSFWMEYEDFLKIFNVIEICDRTTISNLHLNINEDDNTKYAKYKLSILKGCIIGCFEYWCCCKGLRNVYFGRRKSSKSTIETHNKCLSIFFPDIQQNHGKQWKE